MDVGIISADKGTKKHKFSFKPTGECEMQLIQFDLCHILFPVLVHVGECHHSDSSTWAEP